MKSKKEKNSRKKKNQNQTITERRSKRKTYTTKGDQKTKWTYSKTRGGEVWGFQWSSHYPNSKELCGTGSFYCSRMWPDAPLVTIDNLTLDLKERLRDCGDRKFGNMGDVVGLLWIDLRNCENGREVSAWTGALAFRLFYSFLGVRGRRAVS